MELWFGFGCRLKLTSVSGTIASDAGRLPVRASGTSGGIHGQSGSASGAPETSVCRGNLTTAITHRGSRPNHTVGDAMAGIRPVENRTRLSRG